MIMYFLSTLFIQSLLITTCQNIALSQPAQFEIFLTNIHLTTKVPTEQIPIQECELYFNKATCAVKCSQMIECLAFW